MSIDKSQRAFVSYPVLGTILAATAGLYVFLAKAHVDGGHPAMKAEVQMQLEERSRSIDGRLEQFQRAQDTVVRTVDRVERKQDFILEKLVGRFPPGLPKREAASVVELDGGGF